jgi:hypothetical protein
MEFCAIALKSDGRSGDGVAFEQIGEAKIGLIFAFQTNCPYV